MEQNYKYYQPEYVKNFQCDGKKCGARCCKNWQIFIDEKTYEKYSTVPDFTGKIKDFQIILDEKNFCPFLTADNLCCLQKNFGEEFLSETCATYPRYTWNFGGNFYERSLMLTCPVVAETVLLASAPLKFEKICVSEKVHSNFGKIKILENFLLPEVLEIFLSIQQTAIKILQARALTLDERFLIFGLYCDKLTELIDTDNLESVEKVNPAYENLNFLEEQAAQFSAVLKFNAQNYFEIIQGFLKNFFDADKFAAAALQLQPSENIFRLQKNFLQRFSTVFENYSVHEFFYNLYPFRFDGTPIFNYGIFLTIFKMLELITFANSLEKISYDEKDLISEIMLYVEKIDHDAEFLGKITNGFKFKNDVAEIMQSFLQVQK